MLRVPSSQTAIVWDVRLGAVGMNPHEFRGQLFSSEFGKNSASNALAGFGRSIFLSSRFGDLAEIFTWLAYVTAFSRSFG